MRGRVAAAVAAAVLTAGSACGGGGGGSADPGPDTTARPSDQAVAERANLQLSDFPPEWTATPVPDGTLAAAEEQGRTVAACLSRPPPDELREAIAYSPDFSASDTRRASSSVAVVKTPEMARDDFVALRSDAALRCHKEQIDLEFRRQLPGAPPPQTSIQRIDLAQFGEETVAFRITAVSADQGREIRTVIDEVFIRRGRTVLSAFFVNRSAAFPLELQQVLLQRMVGRS